jgi:hypothetical protein
MAHGTRRAEANTSLVMSKSVGMDLQKDLMGQIWDFFRSDWREGAVLEKTSPGALGTQEKVPDLSRYLGPIKHF